MLERAVVVAVVREKDPARLGPLVEGLLEGGVEALEITAPSPGCFDLLRALVARGVPKTVALGVGTVTTVDDLARALDAGGSFVVSPHTEPKLIEATIATGLISIPGAMTPTEILTAHRAGGDVIKVFPLRSLGGAEYIRQVKGPLPEIPLWASGGIGIEEIGDLVEAGVVLIGLTGALTADLGADVRKAARARMEKAIASLRAAHQGRTLLEIRGTRTIQIGLEQIAHAPELERVALESIAPDRRGQAVRIRSFLELAGIAREAEVELASEGGGFRRVMRADPLYQGGVLHYATDGRPLGRAEGGPLRLFVATGATSCDNVKALSQIKVVPS